MNRSQKRQNSGGEDEDRNLVVRMNRTEKRAEFRCEDEQDRNPGGDFEQEDGILVVWW